MTVKNKTITIAVRVTPGERREWERAASRYVRTLGDWLRMVANAASKKR